MRNLMWSSDWQGYEVGFDHVETVGLFHNGKGTNYYIDYATGNILETWEDEEE